MSSRKKHRRPEPRERRADSGAAPSARGDDIATIPDWLGWKRIVLFTALAAIVSAVFVFELTRPHSLLGGLFGWELKRIDDASRNSAAAGAESVTWSSLFAQLERKLPSLPDAQARAGTAQLIYAVDAIWRGELPAQSVTDRIEAAQNAATFNLIARLAFGWIRDRAAAAPSQSSPAPLARFDALARVIDAEPPATKSTLYNEDVHDAWREVLRTAIRREDVMASCVRNIRHFDIREHYAALPAIHATLTALARDLHAAGHASQAEIIRQWLDRAYMGLMDADRDHATRLLAAELLTDTRAEDFYTAAPGHHRPSKLREAFHAQAAQCNSDLVDLYKLPMTRADTGDRLYSLLTFNFGAAAIMTGVFVGLVIRLLASFLQSQLAWMTHQRGADKVHCSVSNTSTRHPHILELWMLPFLLATMLPWLALPTPFLVGRAGSAEGLLIRLAAIVAVGAIVAFMMAAWHYRINWKSSVFIGAASLLPIAVLIVLEPDRSIWPTLRAIDFGPGSVLVIGAMLLLWVIICAALIVIPRRVFLAVCVRFGLILAVMAHLGALSQNMEDRSYQSAVAVDHSDQLNARFGSNWNSLLPPVVTYETSAVAIED